MCVCQYSFNDRLTDNWKTNIRVGAGGTLFLWAMSECFNNEKLGHYIWSVCSIVTWKVIYYINM
jgi:hypothetical protein